MNEIWKQAHHEFYLIFNLNSCCRRLVFVFYHHFHCHADARRIGLDMCTLCAVALKGRINSNASNYFRVFSPPIPGVRSDRLIRPIISMTMAIQAPSMEYLLNEALNACRLPMDMLFCVFALAAQLLTCIQASDYPCDGCAVCGHIDWWHVGSFASHFLPSPVISFVYRPPNDKVKFTHIIDVYLNRKIIEASGEREANTVIFCLPRCGNEASRFRVVLFGDVCIALINIRHLIE